MTLESNLAQSLYWRRRSQRCGQALYLLTFLWGASQIIFPESGLLYLFFALALAVSATLWAIYDARSRGQSILSVLQMLYFFAWPLGAITYLLFRSKWRGLLTAVMHGIGLTTALCVGFYGTFYSLHFTGLLDRRFYE